MILGAHMSIAKGYAQALQDSREELEANALQIFLKSPRGGRAKPLEEDEVAKFLANRKNFNIEFVVGHASYLLNLAKPADKDNWQAESLKDDLYRLYRLGGAGGLVYHVGKYLDRTHDEARQILVKNLKQLLDEVREWGVPLLLENLSGQGTEMGLKLEDLAQIIDEVGDREMLKVCIDTCHAFAAGYELHLPEKVDDFFNNIERTIGLDAVVCFHLNDSKVECGKRRDRHENLGQGHIGRKGLTRFIELANKHKKPLILETPPIDDSYLHDISVARSWIK